MSSMPTSSIGRQEMGHPLGSSCSGASVDRVMALARWSRGADAYAPSPKFSKKNCARLSERWIKTSWNYDGSVVDWKLHRSRYKPGDSGCHPDQGV